MAQGTEVGSIFISLGLNLSSLRKGLEEATSHVESIGRKMESVGRNLTLGLSAPIAAAGGAAVKAAGDFEESFSKIEGLVGLSEEQVQSFQQEVLALSGEVAQSPRELADAMFQITSAGLEGEKALNALQASAKAATAGLGDTKTVADAATSAMNAFGQDALSAAEATDVLTAAVREGKVQPDQLAGSLGKVIPTAAQAGVEFEQVGAAMAAMTRQGANAQRATTALNQLLRQIQDPSKDAQQLLQSVGRSAAGLRRAVQDDGLLAVLDLLKNEFQGNSQALSTLFQNERAARAALQLTGENADQTRQIFDELSRSTGATNQAFQEAKDTFNFRFQQFRTGLEQLRIEIGNELLPAANNLISSTQELISNFRTLDKQSRRNAKAFGALAVAIPPALYVGGKLLVGLSTLASSILPAVATGFGALLSPIGAIVAGITALGGAAAIVETNFLGLRESLGNVFSAIGTLARRAADVITSFFKFAAQRVVKAFQGALNFIIGSTGDLAGALGLSELQQSIKGTFVQFGLFGQSIEETKQQGEQALSDLSDAASGVGDATLEAASTTADNIGKMFAGLRDQMLETLGLLGSGGGGGARQGGQSIESMISGLGEFDAQDSVLGAIQDLTPKLEEAGQGGWQGIMFDQLISTADRVVQDQLSTVQSVQKALRGGLITSINDAESALGTLRGAFQSATSSEQRQRLQALIGRVQQLRQSLENAGQSANALDKIKKGVGNVLRRGLSNVGRGIGQAFTSLFQSTKRAELRVQRLKQRLKQLQKQKPTAAVRKRMSLLRDQLEKAETATTRVGRAFQQIGQTIEQALSRVISKLVSAVAQAAALKVAISLIPGFGQVAGASSFTGILTELLPGAAEGGFVEEGGFARIHEGESVVTADAVEAFQEKIGSLGEVGEDDSPVPAPPDVTLEAPSVPPPQVTLSESSDPARGLAEQLSSALPEMSMPTPATPEPPESFSVPTGFFSELKESVTAALPEMSVPSPTVSLPDIPPVDVPMPDGGEARRMPAASSTGTIQKAGASKTRLAGGEVSISIPVEVVNQANEAGVRSRARTGR